MRSVRTLLCIMAVITISIFPLLILCSTLVLADLSGIPTVPFTSSGDTFDVTSVSKIVVDSQYTSTRDEDGWTLIPPTLQEFAETFSEDLYSIFGCVASASNQVSGSGQAIRLTIDKNGDFHDAAGRFTSEGYKLDVADNGITITGASPLGVWWGTRTVLQQAVLNDGKIDLGSGLDAPGWGTRGVMVG